MIIVFIQTVLTTANIHDTLFSAKTALFNTKMTNGKLLTGLPIAVDFWKLPPSNGLFKVHIGKFKTIFYTKSIFYPNRHTCTFSHICILIIQKV